jgi:hypothetical protein
MHKLILRNETYIMSKFKMSSNPGTELQKRGIKFYTRHTQVKASNPGTKPYTLVKILYPDRKFIPR